MSKIEFPVEFEAIWSRVEGIDVVKYSKTRNFIWGSVTYLSPYISRGVITVKEVRDYCIEKFGYEEGHERFYQELAWREYWQHLWQWHGDGIFLSLRNNQERLRLGTEGRMPVSVLKGEMGISALDNGLNQLYKYGYIHNHLRMYLASVICNLWGYSWKMAADWMYYYLLDGDLASNHLSWQWVAGTNSNKLYFCNQENINKYMGTKDVGTYLDCTYEELMNKDRRIENLEKGEMVQFNLPLETIRLWFVESVNELGFESGEKVFIYHYYHLDPRWRNEEETGRRVFLLNKFFFEAHPIGEGPLKFAMDLARQVPNIRFYWGELEDFVNAGFEVITKEHPIVNGVSGVGYDKRDWLTPKMMLQNSFFAFWKKAKKQVVAVK